MKYWLMKTEPDAFSIEDLKRVGREPWSGVRGFEARTIMKDEMRVGDQVLFYHSSCKVPGVYGVAEVATGAEPDPTQFDTRSEYYDPKSKKESPLWWCVQVAYKSTLAHPVTLEMLKREPALKGLATFHKPRLSVSPVTKAEYAHILKMAKRADKELFDTL